MAKTAPIEDQEIFIHPVPFIGDGKAPFAGDGAYNTIFMTREELEKRFPNPRKVAPKPKPTTDKNINRTLDRVVARITAHKPPR